MGVLKVIDYMLIVQQNQYSLRTNQQQPRYIRSLRICTYNIQGNGGNRRV